MKDEDVVLLHRLWLNITREPGLENIHHHDILTEALTRFASDYSTHDHEDIVNELRHHADSGPGLTQSITNPIPAVLPEADRSQGNESLPGSKE
jgi:hypothetical protein